MKSFTKKPRIEPSFLPFKCDLKTRRDLAKRLIDIAKPAVVDGILILLQELRKAQLVRDLYRSEAKK